MDIVIEVCLVIVMVQFGGMGIIYKNFSLEQQVVEVVKVKKFEVGVICDLIIVGLEIIICDVLVLIQVYNIFGVLVVGSDGLLVGIVIYCDMCFEIELDDLVCYIMIKKDCLIMVKEGVVFDEVLQLLYCNCIEKVLVVNDLFELCGLIIVKDIQKNIDFLNVVKDLLICLLVGVVVGVGGDIDCCVEVLVVVGVDVIVVDIVYGYLQGVLDCVSWVKKNFLNVQVIGGNICIGEVVLVLLDSGVDVVKVGIGLGLICIICVVVGVGVLQVIVIDLVVEVLQDCILLIVDGGICYLGDIGKVLVVGVLIIMVGGLLVGIEELLGEIELYQGCLYKSYRGMGLLVVMEKGLKDCYFQDVVIVDKLVLEGIEGCVLYRGLVGGIIYQLMGGLCVIMGYVGCVIIEDMCSKFKFVKISGVGQCESYVYDVIIIKELLNYCV